MLAARMGRDRKKKLRRDWESAKVAVMREALVAKFSQHDALRDAASPRIEVRVTTRDDEVLVQVRDTGHGIADEDLLKVFDPFFTTKPVGQGTGLGLSISYSIAVEHGGGLVAEKHPDGGALFTLSLPLEDAG